jgi:ribosome maturation factor RimP
VPGGASRHEPAYPVLIALRVWGRHGILTKTARASPEEWACPTLFPVRAGQGNVGARKAQDEVRKRVAQLADQAAALVGVEVLRAQVQEGRGRLAVVVTVDREGGVDLDTVTVMSQTLERLLDREDPIPGPYVLEVQSPGEKRPLRLPQDAARFFGQRVEVAVASLPSDPTRRGAGVRRVRGVLVGVEDGMVLLEGEDGAALRLPLNLVTDAHLSPPRPFPSPDAPARRRRGKGRRA